MAAKCAPVAIRLLPDPVGVLTITWAPDTISMSASSWCGYRVKPCSPAQAAKASNTESGPTCAGSWSMSVMVLPSCPLSRRRVSIPAAAIREQLREPVWSRPRRREHTMKQYLLAVYSAEDAADAASEEEMQRAYQAVDAFNSEVRAAGAWVFAGGLHPSSTATVVRAQGGQVITTAARCAETREQSGGFGVTRAAARAAALDWAAKGPAGGGGRVGV